MSFHSLTPAVPGVGGSGAALPGRDRVVDAARAGSILVVVLWHWALSVSHRNPQGELVMPNPLHTVPGGWLATWVLQVVPVFFLVGGYANLAAWTSAHQRGESVRSFVTRRMRRLLLPFALWLWCWVAVEVAVLAFAGSRGHDVVWQWFPGLVAPLWFLGLYAVLTALTPVTAELHRRHGAASVAVLVALIALGSVLDRVVGAPGAAWVVAGLVWVFCHQLGYLWRSTDLGHRALPVRAAVALAGFAGLAALTTVGGYPRSMVAEVGATSNMLPTTPSIAALAVAQLGLLAVAAYAVTVLAVEALGGQLLAEPTAAWWADRWFWVMAPAAVLALILVVVAPVEQASRGGDALAARRRLPGRSRRAGRAGGERR